MVLVIRKNKCSSLSETTLNGVVNNEATYEIIDGILIIRTTTNDTIHITRDIGKKLVDIINSELI